MKNKNISILYSDVPFKMNLNQHKDIDLAVNGQSVNQSILNILYCSKNARYLNPEFGCNLSKFLFEEYSEETAYSIGYEIKNKLETYDPRISIKSININMLNDEKSYEIEILYYINELQMSNSITFILHHI